VSNRSADHQVEIGVVGRPHGVRGEVRVFQHHTSSKLIEPGMTLRLAVPGQVPSAKIVRTVRPAPKHLIISFAGVTSRAAADALKGASVLIDRGDLPPLEKDEFYVDDLIGMEVYCDQELLGQIESSRAQGGIEVVKVVNDTEEIEIPLVEEYVHLLDQEAGRLAVREVDELPRTPRTPGKP